MIGQLFNLNWIEFVKETTTPPQITSVSWSQNTAQENQTININANISNAEGKTITFDIYEDDIFFDDYITTITATVSQGKASAQWTVLYQLGDDIFGSDLEYIIKANIETSNMQSGTLIVSPPSTTDTTPPTVSITSPQNNSNASNAITITTNATDDIAVAKVDFIKDSELTPFASDIVSPFQVTLNTISLINGAHTIQAKVYDTSGNEGISTPITINVNNTTTDTTPPTTSVTSLSNNEIVSGTITISTNTNDDTTIASVELLRDSSVLMLKTTTAPYSFILNTENLTNGAHTIYTRATDSAGNTTTSAKITINVSNAVTATTPTVVRGTIPIYYTTRHSTSDISKVEFYIDSQTTPFAIDTAAPYQVNLNTPDLLNGIHLIKIKAYDLDGNDIAESSGFNVDVQN